MKINSSSTGEEIAELALAVHELVNRLPLTMRTTSQPGVRIEEGKVIDYHYTGPTLELVLEKGEISHQVPKTGPYQGTPVVVVPIREAGEVIAALGVVDITQGIYSDIIEITKRPEDVNKK
jgi:hypothetical protein